MDFDIADIVITLQTDDKAGICLQFPNIGSQFALCCRHAVCYSLDLNCDFCKKQPDCNWYYVFSQNCATDSFALKRHQKPALPFAFSFPWGGAGGGLKDEGLIELRLVVVGRAIDALEMLLAGFEMLTERGVLTGCTVLGVGSRDLQGAIKPFWNGNLSILSSAWIMESCANSRAGLEIVLQSPLKLLSGGKSVSSFEFTLFGRSVMRRVSSLAYYYGDYEFDTDFRDISGQTAAVVCTDNSFVYSGDNKFSGMVGRGVFEGDLEGILPFLKLGAYLNNGKLAAYGMGQYKLVYSSD